jgi:glycosyltransferase involved in cell wall biosynthesis
VTYLVEDTGNLRDLYRQVDCLALPSRTEGWGMPHREAAMMGLPVITQAHSGLDDGHTHEWAIVVEKGQMRQIDDEGNIAGEWRVADVQELAAKMRHCYENEWQTRKRAKFAREWLKTNQTWDHAASALIRLLVDEGALQDDAPSRELETIRIANRLYLEQHEMSYQWQH